MWGQNDLTAVLVFKVGQLKSYRRWKSLWRGLQPTGRHKKNKEGTEKLMSWILTSALLRCEDVNNNQQLQRPPALPPPVNNPAVLRGPPLIPPPVTPAPHTSSSPRDWSTWGRRAVLIGLLPMDPQWHHLSPTDRGSKVHGRAADLLQGDHLQQIVIVK